MDRPGLALHCNGHITGWGSTEDGQASAPPGLTNAIAIAAGYNHSLDVHRNGRITA
jgi:hypothetical protein